MNIVYIDETKMGILKEFVRNLGDASISFRYFNSRSIETVNNHLITLLILNEDKPIAYGHLELEDEITWLGICVLPEFQGRGYSDIIMIELIQYAKSVNIQNIFLAVDNSNFRAINLYKKYNFTEEHIFEHFTRYILKIRE